MCAATGKPPVFFCTVGDLKVGQEFHTPDGEAWMVIDLSASTHGNQPDSIMVVNLGNARGNYNPYGKNGDELKGMVTPVYTSVKLGHDHKGRLYASTALNDWYAPEDKEPLPLDLAGVS